MKLVQKEPERTKFLRLREPASLRMTVECGTCSVELDIDYGLQCPSCGTKWNNYHGDGDTGYIYSDDYTDDQFEEDYTENGQAHWRGSEVEPQWVWVDES